MADRDPHSQPARGHLEEMAHLAVENEKLRRKQKKVQQRRDHYAKLYYRAQADLDERNWELAIAKSKIQELRTQMAVTSMAQGSPHVSSYYSSQSDIYPTSSRYPPHQPHPHHPPDTRHHHHHPHSHRHIQQHGPNSMPPSSRNLSHGSESDSTSPDSGASFSPGIEPPRHAPFSHLPPKSKTLPSSMRYHGNHTAYSTNSVNEKESQQQHHQQQRQQQRQQQQPVVHGVGREEEEANQRGEEEGREEWVAWQQEAKKVKMPSQYKVGVAAAPPRQLPQEAWGKERAKERQPHPNKPPPDSKTTNNHHDNGDGKIEVNSPVPFQNSRPSPEVLASPIATHRRHPSFDPKLPNNHSLSLSQGDTYSPYLSHPQNRKLPVHGGPHGHFSLSQEAYISSPLYLRKPAFEHASPSHKRGSQTVIGLPASRPMVRKSPLERVTPSQDEVFSDSELEQEPGGSAFFKPPRAYRQLSHPSNMKFSSQHPLPGHTDHSHSLPVHPPNHPSPSQLSHLVSPPLPRYTRAQRGHSHPHPHSSHPQPPTAHPPPPPPPPPTQHTRHTNRNSASHSSPDHPSTSNRSTATDVPMATALTTGSRSAGDKRRMFAIGYETEVLREEEEEEEEEEEVEEGGEEKEKGERERDEECSCERLSGSELLDLLTRISDPRCTIKTLEIADSDLGKPEGMALLCRDMKKNRSIKELSLPNNGIGAESLQLLLDCVQQCRNIKELKLRSNNIGRRCAPILKTFLENTTLDSLVLTGNEIEQHGDLLNSALPSDFTMEYDTTEGSVDSGVVVAEGDHYNHGNQYLNV